MNAWLPRKRRAIPRGPDAAQQRCRCGARPLDKLEVAARAGAHHLARRWFNVMTSRGAGRVCGRLSGWGCDMGPNDS